MTVFELSDGRWRAKEGAHQKEGKTRKIAKDRLLAYLANVDRLKPQPTMTVSALVDAFIARGKAKGRAKNTLRDYEYHAEPIREAIGHLQVSALTGTMIKEKVLEGLPTKAQVNRRAFLRAAINKIIKPDFKDFANPAEFAEPESYKAVGARPLYGSETAKLLEAEEDPMHLAMWLLLLDSGLRPDEAYGLQWSEIRREEDGWWLKLAESKTDEGLKPIPLSDTTVDALRKATSHPTWVFPSSRKKDQPLGQTYWCGKFKALVEKAGIDPERVTPYSLRHTFASTHARKTKDEVLKRLMRHKDIRTTKQYYVEVELAELRRAKA